MTNADFCRYCPRCVDAGALMTLAELMPMVATEHLRALRVLLLDDGRWAGLTPSQRVMRAELIDATARRLVVEQGFSEESAIARGELLPAVPDSPEGI